MRLLSSVMIATLSIAFLNGGVRADAPLDARCAAGLESVLRRDLPQGPRPGTWVDTERWCVAHAALRTGRRLDEANLYLAGVQWVSLSYGLIADTDVQVTDLLRTWFEFGNSDRLQAPARAHLRQLFAEWQTPNTDRNRDARTRYEWPHEYTENHSFSIVAAGYLIDTALDRNRAASRQLAERFLDDRVRWGWAEFYSTRYGMVTAKTLLLLVDFAPDASVRETARLLMDLWALDFAAQGLPTWRGMPANRGAAHETSNAQNAVFNLARLWFGGAAVDGGAVDPMLTHFLTSGYRPPAEAVAILADLGKRPVFFGVQTVTTGPSRERIPIAIWSSPVATMATARGVGHFYEGTYASISFASAPGNLVTVRYGREYNQFQDANVLAACGEVRWNGALRIDRTGTRTVGTDGRAWLGQIELGEDWHLLFLGTVTDYPDRAAFDRALDRLAVRRVGGVVSWTAPDGRKIEMTNRPGGGRWEFERATADGALLRTDRNLLFDAPFLRSVRGSGVFEVVGQGDVTVWTARPGAMPTRVLRKGALTPLPPDEEAGPLPDLRMVYVPAGDFLMGSDLTEGRANERPLRRVTLDGFHISKHEITLGQWKLFLKDRPELKQPDWYWTEWDRDSRSPETADRFPVTQVSWSEAVAFCDWLSRKTGARYRLPTEAEWEKAAKGYAHRRYPWGDRYDGTQSGSRNETYLPVGAMPRDMSGFGVMDLAGNAWEWCTDRYSADAYANGDAVNPAGAGTGELRSIRGAGWNFDPDTFRCAYRTAWIPEGRSVHIGFRIVRGGGK